jgi:hypothetical protein
VSRQPGSRRPTVPWPLYNPALLPAELIGLAHSLRKPLASRLLALLRRIGARGAPQHQLILGAPGSGKTMLLRALQLEVARDPELGERWLSLTFAEAQWDVARPADLWLNALDYLAVALERAADPGERRHAAELAAGVAALPDGDDDVRAAAALALLTATADRLGRRFLLLVDTLDVVLDRLKREQWHVREVLSSEPRLLVIGTSARAVEATYRYDAAFYDFFQLHELRPLPRASLSDALAGVHPDDPLAHVRALAERHPAFLQAAIDILGAQPRTLALLGVVLGASRGRPGPDTLLATLDLMSPALSARIGQLAPQIQQLVHALAAHWHPARPSELAQRTHLSANVVSAQLHRMQQEGLVDKTALPGARHGFVLADRLLQVWLLMRMGQPHRRRLCQAIELLVSIHGGARPSAGLGNPTAALLDAIDLAEEDAVLRVAPELRALLPASDRPRAE